MVICVVLNVACILAQWHEAALLCKRQTKLQLELFLVVVLLCQAFVTCFVALLAGSEIIPGVLQGIWGLC